MRARTGRSTELAHRASRMIATLGARRLLACEVARRLGCSPSHLSRTFTRVHGLTLTAYRTETRLHHALSCLRADPGADLTEVALECGFSSHSHFTAIFRKRLGMTPSAFAASLLTAPERTPASAVPCGTCNR